MPIHFWANQPKLKQFMRQPSRAALANHRRAQKSSSLRRRAAARTMATFEGRPLFDPHKRLAPKLSDKELDKCAPPGKNTRPPTPATQMQ